MPCDLSMAVKLRSINCVRRCFFPPLIRNRQTSSKQIHRCPFVSWSSLVFFLMHICSWTMNTIRMDDDEWAYSFKVKCLTSVCTFRCIHTHTHVACLNLLINWRTWEKYCVRIVFPSISNPNPSISDVRFSSKSMTVKKEVYLYRVWNGMIYEADVRL